MNVFGDCPVRNTSITIKNGPYKGNTFDAEDWARNVMAKGAGWPQDIGNPAVIQFWALRPDLLKSAEKNEVEYMRVALTGIYGHIGWSGCLLMPEELGIEVDDV